MNRDDSEVQKDAKREETTKEVVHTGVALSISDVVSRYGNTNYDAYDGGSTPFPRTVGLRV